MNRLNPNVIDIDPERRIHELARQHNVDIQDDAVTVFRQAVQDHEDRLCIGVTRSSPEYIERNGARYVFTQYNYANGQEAAGNRMLAAIRPGDRTELAYWKTGSPDKTLTIHRGIGTLVLGYSSTNSVELVPLDSEATPEVALPAGSFYSIEASNRAKGLLVVSGLYVPPVTNWEEVELEIMPGQQYVNVEEGRAIVPDSFRERYEV